MDSPEFKPGFSDSVLNTAAREVFEQALARISEVHEQQVSELEEEITFLRQQLAKRPVAKTVISLDDDALHEDVALWVRTEFNKTLTTPVKAGAGAGANGVKGVSLLEEESIQSDNGLKDTDVQLSVAMAVAAEVQAECDDDDVESFEIQDDANHGVRLSVDSITPPASPAAAAEGKSPRRLNSLSGSIISGMSDATVKLDQSAVSGNLYDFGSEYLYHSPSEPVGEDDDDDPIDFILQRWKTMVDGVLKVAKEKKLYELRDPWVQPDWFLAKMMRQQDNLDLFHPKNIKQRGSHAASNRRTTRVIEKLQMSSVQEKRCSTDWLVLDPQSPKRIFWMSIGMFLMIYDLFVLPMQAFPLPNGWFLRSMQWFGQIFWTLDIFVSFLTGIYVNSELVTRVSTIARAYCSTWLIFDLLVVVPLWIVEFLGINSGAEKSMGVFKYIRMLRFLRLARLAKFEHYLQEALATVNSSALLLCFGMFKQMSSLIILNHINACIWYAVGKYGTGGWVEAYADAPLTYRYLTSMHWAFTQFQGTSEIVPTMGKGRELLERLHAVVTVMFALIILAFFVSRLTNMMLQLQQLRDERTGMQRDVRAYLCANNISLHLSVRVKKYIDWKQNLQTKCRSSKVLTELPVGLQMDLQEEVRGPLITLHTLFSAFRCTHLRFFRMLCFQGLSQLSPAPRELLFVPNDRAQNMYFIVTGTFRYIVSKLSMLARHQAIEEALMANNLHDDIMELSNGRWLSEPVLWTNWDHRGGCMGMNDAQLLTLSSGEFAKCVKHHQAAHASGVLYARQFVAGLNRFGKNYCDVIEQDTLIHEMADQRFSVTESKSIR